MAIFSPELEDSQLLLDGLDFEPCSIVKSSPIAANCCGNDGPMSPISEISGQQIFPFGEAELTCSQPVSHANRLPLPGSAEARKMTVGSGTQLSMLLDQSTQLGAFSKILLASSHWTNSEEYSYVWSRLDTRFGLSAFQLTAWEPSTDDNGSLLWLTPCAGVHGELGPNGQKSIQSQALWRTPNGSDVTGGAMNGEVRLAQGHQLNLQEQAATPKLWPTPRKEGYDSQGKGHGDLVYEVKSRLLPTPLEWDYRSGKRNKTQEQRHRGVPGLAETFCGSLNPRFVCWLQMFPQNWTQLEEDK